MFTCIVILCASKLRTTTPFLLINPSINLVFSSHEKEEIDWDSGGFGCALPPSFIQWWLWPVANTGMIHFYQALWASFVDGCWSTKYYQISLLRLRKISIFFFPPNSICLSSIKYFYLCIETLEIIVLCRKLLISYFQK